MPSPKVVYRLSAVAAAYTSLLMMIFGQAIGECFLVMAAAGVFALLSTSD